MTEDGVTAHTCNCKVGTLIRTDSVRLTNEELVRRWTDDSGDSVRTLAEELNQRLLGGAMRDADMDIEEGRVENLYSVLTDDENLDAVQMQARSTLERKGIDVDALEDDFISHQSMYRHLRNCLDAEKQRTALSVDKERDRVSAVKNRAESVVEDATTRLRDGGKLDIDEFEVLINFRITCENCGTLHDVVDLLDAGGCDCSQ